MKSFDLCKSIDDDNRIRVDVIYVLGRGDGFAKVSVVLGVNVPRVEL